MKNTPQDPFWDELGIGWRTVEVDTSAVVSKLEPQLRRQSLAATVGLWLGTPAALAALLLGGATMWIGAKTHAWNFLTRGLAIVIVAGLAMRSLWLLFESRRAPDAKPLTKALSVAVYRIERTISIVRLALAACVTAAVLGTAGTIIRMKTSTPPALSPIVDLIIVALIFVALVLYLQQSKRDAAKFRYLLRSVSED